MSLPIINFGSCCIDHVYAVDHFVNPGETLPCTGYEVHPGGKGLNQSIALARAGAEVLHAGRIGQDGQWLKTLLDDEGVGTELLLIDDGPTGHANIQVSSAGENAIVLFGGANRKINREDIDRVLSQAVPGQLMLLQNEISELDYLVDKAIETGLRLVLNAAPMADNIKHLPLEQFELLIINEIEGEALAGAADPGEILRNLRAKFPATRLLLTLGEAGAVYQHGDTQVTQEAASVEVKDSTGAGDTFTGYFLANYSRDDSIEHCLRKATLAAGISVTRNGAASSIPEAGELDNAG